MDSKKVFLINWSTEIPVAVAQELKKRGANIAYWALDWTQRADAGIDRKEFPQTVFHHVLEAMKALPAPGINVADFEPISQELAAQLSECECQTLTMMNRMDYTDATFHQRKRVYYQILKYWHGVLKQMRPDVILFAQSPHMVYDFVLYSLAKVLNIETLILDMSTVPYRLLLFDDIKKFDQAIVDELPKSPGRAAKEDLPKDLQDYCLKMSSQQQAYLSYKPGFSRRTQTNVYIPYKPNLGSALQKIKRGNFLGLGKSLWNYLLKIKKVFSSQSHLATFEDDFKGLQYVREKRKWEKKKQGFRQEYEKLQVQPDLGKKFVFFPLQFQPEKSTSPLADVFVDQLLTVDILSKAVPKDWLIYIKEHPAQWMKGVSHGHQGRHGGYYQQLVKYKNVCLVPMEIATLDFILNCQALSTAAGTTGWEALLRGKPVLCFGYPVFRHCEGVFRVSNTADCQKAITQIANGYQLDVPKVLNFLNVLDKVSVRGHLKERWEGDAACASADNIKNIVDALSKKLLLNG